MLVDYREATDMFMQSTAMWHGNITIEGDHTKSGTTHVRGHKGWESCDKDQGISQRMLGISDRYLLSLGGENVPGIH